MSIPPFLPIRPPCLPWSVFGTMECFCFFSPLRKRAARFRNTIGVRGQQEDTCGSPAGEGFKMFCPYCANLLVVEPFGGAMRFACKTCPYHYNIGKRLKKAAHIEQKKVAIRALSVCLSVRPFFWLVCWLIGWVSVSLSCLSSPCFHQDVHESRVLPMLADCCKSTGGRRARRRLCRCRYYRRHRRLPKMRC